MQIVRTGIETLGSGMETCERVRCIGSFEVGLPPDQAYALFTPEGERSWVEGWDPSYPSPLTDDSEPGAVFTTEHGDGGTTWMAVRREGRSSVAYCFISHGDRAGLISVSLEPSARGTRVTVGHQLTALAPSGNEGVRSFAAGYDAVMAQWEAWIAGSLSRTRG